MSWRGLSTRLAKIEAKRPCVSHLPIIIAQYPEEGAGPIVGLKVGDDVFPRSHDGQNLADFALLIQDATGGPLPFNAPRIMIAVYARSKLFQLEAKYGQNPISRPVERDLEH